MMTFQIKAQSEGMKVEAEAGNHALVMDEGSQMGGKDAGPNPLQTTLSALASCENVTAHIAAKEMDFDLQGIEFEISGKFDPKGFMGDPNVRPYFQTVTVNAKVTTSESEERLKELQEKVEARCPVYTMMKAADVDLQDEWKIKL